MPDVVSPPRLVGQPLLYAISIFASLGVFLVRLALHPLFSLSDASQFGYDQGYVSSSIILSSFTWEA